MNAREAVGEMITRFGTRVPEMADTDDFVAENYEELRASGMLAAAVPVAFGCALATAPVRRNPIASEEKGRGTESMVNLVEGFKNQA